MQVQISIRERRRGNFEGEYLSGPGHARACPAVDNSKRLSRGQHRYGADADWAVIDGVHISYLANTNEPSVCCYEDTKS